MKLFYKTKGFTLIELMVVIAIIGLLASIITVSLFSAQAKGRDAKRVADIRTIQLALEEYYNDNGYYPTVLSSIVPTYIAALPTDPSNSSQYLYSSYDSADSSNCTGSVSHPYPNQYHLAASMESTAATNSALNQDADWTYPGGGGNSCTPSTADFNGNALNCSGTTAVSPASADNCYDVTN